jgi:hypothetical protein
MNDNIYNVTVDSCYIGYHCNITDRTTWNTQTVNFYCTANENLPNVHNENCTINSHCASNNCNHGHCVGFPNNSPCSSTKQCGSGLYCNPTINTCVEQHVNGTCEIDEECVNYQGCHNGTCTDYWSLQPNTPVIQSRAEEFCETGFAFNGTCYTLVNNAPIPYKCEDTCFYTIKEIADPYYDASKCVCGYNSYGNSYCQLDSTSNAFALYKQAVIDILYSGCHVSKKYSCYDQVSRNSYANLVYLHNAWKGYLQEADRCLAIIYSYSGFINTNIITAIAISLLLILI